MEDAYLGIDTGSVSCNIALVSGDSVLHTSYSRVRGKPIDVVQEELRKLKDRFPEIQVKGVCCTGTARFLIGNIVGADLVKNEITCHAAGTMHFVPDVRTILEIGGQDSKIIIVKDRVVTDFGMNTVCAAGTGSFLDQQAARLGIEIEGFGDEALQSQKEVAVRGRCGIFAESDIINKQMLGHKREDILMGLCRALVRNYMNNVAKGKHIAPPVVLQGGVAANKGIKKAFEDELGAEVIIPMHYNVMGAIGAALLAQEENPDKTRFKGYHIGDADLSVDSFICRDCPNHCEITVLSEDGKKIAHLGSRCGKYV